MTVEEMTEKVTAVVVDKLNVKPEQVVDEASFVDDLGADSLDQVELIMALEDEFDLEIPDEDAEKLKDVKSVKEYIQSKA